MSLVDDQLACGIGWSALKQMGLILEGSFAVYPLISLHRFHLLENLKI
jgi:hypothetical protein